MPRLPPVRFSWWMSVTSTRAPLAPIGWPSATPPPQMFSFDSGIPSGLMSTSTWPANASLISKRSMSATVRPFFARIASMPSFGAKKSSFGAVPAVFASMIFAIGVAPVFLRPSSLITRTAAAPSEIWLALPAVAVPSLPNAGFSFARPSAVVSARMPSSASTPTFAMHCSAESATISPLKWPAAVAAAAR